MKELLNMFNFYKAFKYYKAGKKSLKSKTHIDTQVKIKIEIGKESNRTEILNFLLSQFEKDTQYLEIGVRNPIDNFSKIKSSSKYSVDPGVEFETNPVDFKMTSDAFFSKLKQNKILSCDMRFDVIFIDGLHLAEQVEKDIANALYFVKDGGFIVLHDCNPPTEWHARENYDYMQTPARGYWNGTTWKAFLRYRFDNPMNSCCIDSDWGVGVISKNYQIGRKINSKNNFFEFNTLDENRKDLLGLIEFSDFKKMISKILEYKK